MTSEPEQGGDPTRTARKTGRHGSGNVDMAARYANSRRARLDMPGPLPSTAQLFARLRRADPDFVWVPNVLCDVDDIKTATSTAGGIALRCAVSARGSSVITRATIACTDG